MFLDLLNLIPLVWLLSGLVYLLAGWLLQKFPPKKINHLVGYRTPRSMRSQQAWDFAQQYGGRWLAFAGAILVIAGVGATYLPSMSIEMELAISLGILILLSLLPILLTERQLKKRFPG